MPPPAVRGGVVLGQRLLLPSAAVDHRCMRGGVSGPSEKSTGPAIGIGTMMIASLAEQHRSCPRAVLGRSWCPSPTLLGLRTPRVSRLSSGHSDALRRLVAHAVDSSPAGVARHSKQVPFPFTLSLLARRGSAAAPTRIGRICRSEITQNMLSFIAVFAFASVVGWRQSRVFASRMRA